MGSERQSPRETVPHPTVAKDDHIDSDLADWLDI